MARTSEVACGRELAEPPLRVLQMVRHLHIVGYERLRICSGISHNGQWRCLITIAANMFKNGWLPRELAAVHAFLAENGVDFFGWEGSCREDARSLAITFLFRNADQLRAAEGRDPAYARWFAERLQQAEQGRLPVQFSGGTLAFLSDAPAPPPLPAEVTAVISDVPMIAMEDLILAHLPAAGAPYEMLYPFALTIDGYLWSMATGRDLQELAAAVDAEPQGAFTLDELRASAFFWQRCEKWASSDWEAQKYIAKLRSTIERIRRALIGAHGEMAVDSRSM